MTKAKEWSYQNEAEEFDRTEHDPRRGKRVELRVGREPKSTLAVRFDGADIGRLRRAAENEGVGITQLVRTWVLDLRAGRRSIGATDARSSRPPSRSDPGDR